MDGQGGRQAGRQAGWLAGRSQVTIIREWLITSWLTNTMTGGMIRDARPEFGRAGHGRGRGEKEREEDADDAASNGLVRKAENLRKLTK